MGIVSFKELKERTEAKEYGLTLEQYKLSKVVLTAVKKVTGKDITDYQQSTKEIFENDTEKFRLVMGTIQHNEKVFLWEEEIGLGKEFEKHPTLFSIYNLFYNKYLDGDKEVQI